MIGAREGLLEAKAKFRAECAAIRPGLHRFCARMLGSVTEGEDVVQETLAIAFYRLGELSDEGALRPWIFRIAYRKCLDLQRSRRRFRLLEEDDPEEIAPTNLVDEHEARVLAARALSAIVLRLPVRERAAVVLKDVLDHSLEEIAAMTESSLGAVKAALHRGRVKLRDLESAPEEASPEQSSVVAEYVARFNRRDWDGVRALLADDVRLELVDRHDTPLGDRYFTNYMSLTWTWRLALAIVDGQLEIVHFVREGDAWRARAVVMLRVVDEKVHTIRDYVHVDYLLEGSNIVPSSDL